MYELGIETGEQTPFEFYGNGHHSIWRHKYSRNGLDSYPKWSLPILYFSPYFSQIPTTRILSHTRHVIISYFHVTPSSSVFSNDYFLRISSVHSCLPYIITSVIFQPNGNWSLVFPYSDNSFDTPSIKWMTIDKSYVLPCWILGQAKHSFWFWC